MQNLIRLNPYHLTFYYEWKLNPLRTDYHVVIDQILEGNLDVESLNTALKKMISEYLLMNSHIEEYNDNYYWVKNTNILELEYYDNIKHLHVIKEFIEKPLNLESGHLYRYAAFKLEENKYRIVYILHHILVDGLSANKLYNEISNYYNNKNYSCEISLLEQEKNISNLSENLIARNILHHNKYIDFWSKKLLNIEPVNLDFIKKSEKKNSNLEKIQENIEIGEIRFQLDKEIYDKLIKIRKAHKISLYLFSKIVFAITLHKYTGQNEISIGYPIAIIEGINLEYGANINTSVFILSINDNLNILDLILQAKTFIKSMKEGEIKYNYFPVYELTSINKNNIINLLFLDTNLQDMLLKFDDIKSSIHEKSHLSITNDIMFETQKTNDSFAFRVNYNEDKISKELIENFCQSYQYIYLQVVNNLLDNEFERPLNRIKDLSPITKENYEKIIHNFSSNKTRKFSNNKLIHELFEDQVHKTPNNIAIISGKNKLTYEELNQRANQLAHYIKEKYLIEPNDLIAICLRRNEYLLISILAILKTGGAYVPIDPDFPKERIEYILQDTNAKILLTNESNKKCFSNDILNLFNAHYVDSKETENKLIKQKNKNLISKTQSNHLSYVIYTSGSTGKPKGVMMNHEGCVNRIIFMIEQNEMNQDDLFLFKTNIVFDVSFSDIFTALISGSQIFITEDTFNIEEISRLIKENNITICHFVPSQFKAFCEEVDFATLKSLKKIMFSGESFDTNLIKNHNEEDRTFFNYYGPTETGEITLKKYNSKSDFHMSSSNIGKGFWQSKMYILDKNLAPVPIGAIGELHIGGIGLARGYLNKKELTEEKFITNPFQTENDLKSNKNTRLYKTGDLVRWLLNGEIEYIGRNDSQVKIRGLRIELSEIENVILEFQGINQVFVSLKSLDESSLMNENKVIICYYVSENEIIENELIKHILFKLPVYMLPSYFIKTDKIPLTSNGKIDKKSLLNIKILDKKITQSPRNEIEEKVCKIFSETFSLQYSEMSIYDDFFELGGNSITGIKLLNKLNKEFNIKIKLSDIFIYKKIEEISLQIKNITPNYQTIVSFHTPSKNRNLFLIHPAFAGCEVYSNLASNMTSYFNCYGVDSYNLYNEKKIDDLTILSEYYYHRIKDLNTKSEQKEYHLLGWSLGGYIALEIASILEQNGIKNINIYLLDTFYMAGNTDIDDLDFSLFILNIENEIIKRGYPKSFIDKILENKEIDKKLSLQKMSTKLKYTKVLLFKCMQEQEEYNDENLKNDSKNFFKYEDNNIRNTLCNDNQLTISHIQASHISIIDEGKIILSEMKKFILRNEK